MGFEHNDIVTVDVMNAAIAAGGGGGGDLVEVSFSFQTEPDYAVSGLNASYNDILGIISQGKIPYTVITDEQAELLGMVSGSKVVLVSYQIMDETYLVGFATTAYNYDPRLWYFASESPDTNMVSD